MRSNNLYYVFGFLLMVSCSAKNPHSDHDHHDEHESHEHEEAQNTGPDKAVTKADPHLGLQLSEPAIKTIGLKTLPFNPSPSFAIPHASLVHERTQTGIYRLREGWFKFIPMPENPASDHRSPQSIQSADLKQGDQIVIEGASFLRIAELDVFSSEAEGHHH